MEELEGVLNSDEFFRANRTYLMHINAIKEVLVYSNSRLKVVPFIDFQSEIIVSREKVNAFKQWFSGN